MHNDLAELKIERAAVIDRTGAAIPTSLSKGWCAFRVKSAKSVVAVAAALALPKPGSTTAEACAIGPGDWLLFAPNADRDALAARIAAIPGAYAVDVSDKLAIFDLGNAAALLAQLTGLDLLQFGPSRVMRTKLAGIAVTLTTSDDGGVRMIFDASYIDHIVAFLDRAL